MKLCFAWWVWSSELAKVCIEIMGKAQQSYYHNYLQVLFKQPDSKTNADHYTGSLSMRKKIYTKNKQI